MSIKNGSSVPFFSVIMNCHNSELYIDEALKSATQQSFQDFEIIVFDNASTDSTAQIVSTYADSVTYYYNSEKCALGAARNKAIAKAKGKYLAFLDSDDIWSLTKLEVQHAALISNNYFRQVGLCGSDAMRVSSDLNPIARFSLGRIVSSGNVIGALLHECFISMSSAVVDRKICLSLGGFNENYDIVEDYDLWLRIARTCDVIYQEDCLVSIRFHESNTSKNYNLLHDEVRKMFSDIYLWDEIESSVISSGALAWELRYKVMHLFDLSDGNILTKIKEMLQIFYFSIKNPRLFLSFVKRYMSGTLVRFAIVKS
jgi:glycosyltransferase involved in cell wall biosynthesis